MIVYILYQINIYLNRPGSGFFWTIMLIAWYWLRKISRSVTLPRKELLFGATLVWRNSITIYIYIFMYTYMCIKCSDHCHTYIMNKPHLTMADFELLIIFICKHLLQVIFVSWYIFCFRELTTVSLIWLIFCYFLYLLLPLRLYNIKSNSTTFQMSLF